MFKEYRGESFAEDDTCRMKLYSANSVESLVTTRY